MQMKYAFLTAILAILSPILTIMVAVQIEPETAEAVAGGLIIGCVIGSVFGAVSLILNKSKSEWVNVLAIIPMSVVVIFMLSLVAYWTF